jgi:type VII secretion protein EccB
VDLSDRAVTGALALDGVEPRPVSAGLLAAIPEVPPITAPRIEGAGERSPHRLGEAGSVVAVPHGETTAYYVVLQSGVQRIGAATADLIRFTDSRGETDIRRIAPDVLASVPLVTELDVATFPATAPATVPSAEAPVSCLNWRPGSQVVVLSGRELPVDTAARPVNLAQADGSGPLADAAYMQPGTGAYVQGTGSSATSARRGGLFYVADTGVRYGIADAAAAGMLGIGTNPEPAPWAIASLLAPAPVLSPEQARIAHDGVAPDSAPAALPAE